MFSELFGSIFRGRESIVKSVDPKKVTSADSLPLFVRLRVCALAFRGASVALDPFVGGANLYSSTSEKRTKDSELGADLSAMLAMQSTKSNDLCIKPHSSILYNARILIHQPLRMTQPSPQKVDSVFIRTLSRLPLNMHTSNSLIWLNANALSHVDESI
jgi:hypothetical protein